MGLNLLERVVMDQYVGIGLVNPKSPSNVGSVMRAAGCYRANEVLYTGERYDRAASFQTDTHQAASRLPLQRVDDLLHSVTNPVRIVCIELVVGAISLPTYQHHSRALYIFGPEDGSIDQAIVDQADDVLYVPTDMCMNLAASVNVLLYDRLAKSDHALGSDELVRASRDTNNRLTRNPP